MPQASGGSRICQRGGGVGTDHSERAEREPKRVSGAEQGVFNSDLAVTKSKTITESNCSSFTQTITKTKSKKQY